MCSHLLLIAQRALASVEAMEMIIVQTALVNFLSSQPTKSPEKLIGAWCTQKARHVRTQRWLSSLGKKITFYQVNTLSLSHGALLELKVSHHDGEELTKVLYQQGVMGNPV